MCRGQGWTSRQQSFRELWQRLTEDCRQLRHDKTTSRRSCAGLERGTPLLLIRRLLCVLGGGGGFYAPDSMCKRRDRRERWLGTEHSWTEREGEGFKCSITYPQRQKACGYEVQSINVSWTRMHYCQRQAMASLGGNVYTHTREGEGRLLDHALSDQDSVSGKLIYIDVNCRPPLLRLQLKSSLGCAVGSGSHCRAPQRQSANGLIKGITRSRIACLLR